MPYEYTLGEIYLPPLLVVAFIAYLLTNLITEVGAKLGIYRVIAAPALFELSLFVLITTGLGTAIKFT
jgi:hypothetical protein